jgi:hypothetical protein
VSYLRDKYQMDFKDPHAKAYYKGASIGKGSKLDFTNLHRSNPGVGVYNLPSIWDRYWFSYFISGRLSKRKTIRFTSWEAHCDSPQKEAPQEN